MNFIFQFINSKLLEKKVLELEKNHYIKLQFPSDIEEGWDDLIGMESEKEYLQDAISFFEGKSIYSEKGLLQPITRFLLAGALGAGKSQLVRALAKKADVPLITCSADRFPSSQEKVIKIFRTAFDVVKRFPNGCILTIEHFSVLPSFRDEKTNESGDLIHSFLATEIQESKKAVVILQTATTFSLAPFYIGHDMFNINRAITIVPPNIDSRKKLFSKFFTKYNLKLNDDFIERLAKNTMGLYPKDIEYIVEETLLRAARTGASRVEFKDFHETILQIDAGKESHTKMTEDERIATAYHEAGHVIAAYYSNPKYILGRVEITPRTYSLGLTLEEVGEEKYSFFKKDYEYQMIYSLGGMAAEKSIFGQTSGGVSGDLMSANACASLMIMNLGMDDELGPIVYDDDYGLTSEKYYAIAEDKIQKLLKEMFEKTMKIISEHMKSLEALTRALLEHEVLVGDEIKRVLEEAEKNE